MLLILLPTGTVRSQTYCGYYETGLPYQILVMTISIPGVQVEDGDCLCVFDESLPVGGKFLSPTTADSINIAAWEKDDNHNLPGFTVGNQMLFEFHDASTGELYTLEAIYKPGNGDGTFGFGIYTIVDSLYGDPLNDITIDDELSEYDITPELSQNYPNPFNMNTMIEYFIPRRSVVELSIYNILGEKIKTLVNGIKSRGHYLINWDGTDSDGRILASGLYLYRLKAKENIMCKKMVMLK
ncbi:MAG: FlgD immunoglobulin-like domain containing protein [candidate division Zixibacteria bacterium]|nr:FlgD immunoglobulin-like domain containing protein [candidate division Zixibacteria bacterium]